MVGGGETFVVKVRGQTWLYEQGKSVIVCPATKILFDVSGGSWIVSRTHSGGARKFMELGQNVYRKFTCDIIYKQS